MNKMENKFNDGTFEKFFQDIYEDQKPSEEFRKRFDQVEKQLDSNEIRKTYGQQWRQYNLAQTSEKIMFMDILCELCQYVEDDESKGKGRPTLSRQEMLYCMNLLVYPGKSSRRTIAELNLSKERGNLSMIPHFNSVLNYFAKKELQQKLLLMLKLSSQPLKHIEKDFTVDSSGFSTSVFER